MESINLPPFAPTLMESTRAIGYTLETSIADIIDNSLSAKAKRIDIGFFPKGASFVSILDDGIGMTRDELVSAMQYGSKNPNELRETSDLGRYGLGLKTASFSQCRILTVISKKHSIITGCRWDLDHVQKARDWALLILDESEMFNLPSFDLLKKMKSGTLVIWQDLDKLRTGENNFEIAFGKKMNIVRERISLLFHRYLSGEQDLKKVEIYINGSAISPSDPFLIKKSTQIMADEVIIIKNEKVIVKPFILPHLSKLSDAEIKMLGGIDGLRKNQGFYVYRNKRLLVWGTWFKLMRQGDLSKLARVQVDIPNSLDDLWTLDIKKSTAIPPDEVKKNLSNIIEKFAESSKRTWTFRGKKEIDDTKIHIWNRMKARDNGIYYEINRDHPLVNSIITTNPNSKSYLYSLLKNIEGSLPLNSLYIDLTNDEKISNETSICEIETIKLLKAMLAECRNYEMKEELFLNLQNIEPFCNYYESVEKAFRNGDLL